MVNKFLYPAGGAETYMFKLGKYWSDQGNEVEYFGMNHPDNVVGNRWKLYTASMDFHRKGIFANAANPFRIIYSREAKKKIGMILERFQPDVVHMNNFNYQLTPSVLLAVEDYRKRTGRKVQVIYTAHDSQLVCPNHYMYRPKQNGICDRCLHGSFFHCALGRCIHGSFMRSLLGSMEAIYWKKRKVYQNIDAIICPSLFMKRQLDTNPDFTEKTVTICNFVEPVKGEGQKKGSYVLYFGRYSEEKGIRTLLQACRELPQIPFVFAGEGPLGELTKGIPNVKNVGFLNGKELDKVIREARFSVCPSECNENCPFSIIESMMHGTPVLGSDRGGIPELIDIGYTGWLFSAGNKEELRDTINRIWESKEPEIFEEECRKKSFDSLETYSEKLLQWYRPQ